eukprot:11168376-Lingulodinium_polyedra.AAC.1
MVPQRSSAVSGSTDGGDFCSAFPNLPRTPPGGRGFLLPWLGRPLRDFPAISSAPAGGGQRYVRRCWASC